ncbi:hypothetical protein BDW22DRAFT_1056994 [Trametopsis cervina]|nr:hypothetical protein BDW22DRAFT_1056994 [Trametopsis cervina]
MPPPNNVKDRPPQPQQQHQHQQQQVPRMKSMPSLEQVDGEFVERTKSGSISRMRSHNGNKPMIPQNHRCTMCHAKFTRVTHLQRHMRTHSSKRQYACERCGNSFTRSDLLTRHKRTCGDANTSHKSRRRSCKACVEGKARCDQNMPCARCSSKQWACVYEQRESQSPSTSRPKRTGSGAGSSLLPPVAGPSRSSLYTVPEGSKSLSHLDDNSDLHLLHTIDDDGSQAEYKHNPFHTYRTYTDYDYATTHETSYAGSSYADESVLSGEQSRGGGGSGAYGLLPQGHSYAQGMSSMNSAINTLLSDQLMQTYYYDVIKREDEALSPSTSLSLLSTAQDTTFPWSAASNVDPQPFMAQEMPFGGMDALSLREATAGAPGPSSSGHPAPFVNAPDYPAPPAMPYPSEYEQYIHLFSNMFLSQMPIMHIATLTLNDKPPILISAMQACGALYVRTPAAQTFIDETLSSARDLLVAEFEANPQSIEMQTHLILAVTLLQTIGLYHQSPAQRSHSQYYHKLLVSMIRHSGLIHRVTQWRPPTWAEIECGEQVWHDWAFHETTKRALLLSYLHDTCHCIYFTLDPSYEADEVTAPLPCETPLWDASNYQEWRSILMARNSPFGSLETRLRPLTLLGSLQILADSSLPEDEPPIIVTPFAHFILAHAILRKLFRDCVEREHGPENHNEACNVQDMLHHWLRSWLQSPETPRATEVRDPIFLHDALPFYWIAQLTLLAHQEDILPFGMAGTGKDKSGEGKFTLVKEWLRLIRDMLRKGEDQPTLFWDKLMKIRMGKRAGEEEGGRVSPGGLLGFFEE